MGIIKRTVSGSGEELKLVKNGKTAPVEPIGGTDGMGKKSNKILKPAKGYIEDAPTMMGDTSHSRSFTSKKSSIGTDKAVSVSDEDVTKGMGGKFIK